ncbi:aspartyl/asparaginyl beta-hydroxylase domain-containing protein [Hymenobacter chitinivorans]|uniref:aspartyl/asparaginyl beta-hydroxylase domain-containing protein n=1 Tax=Hymenobacter chitinivorans TaxID=89969 RepID=UPI0012FD66E9|nr:aspartyl/asparaginyl beta-hydroxylase domain-containing protein [Hymenobacter chitinivorans]
MIQYIRFDQQFDAARLQQEVARLTTALWQDHYNRGGYEGSWRTLQLRALHGQLTNNVASHAGTLPDAAAFRDTPLLAQCPYTKEVLDFFQIEKTAVRFMQLDAGAVIKPHCDPDLNFEQGEVRLHIPVLTNPQLHFYLEEERLVLDEGSCWYLNLSRPHQVKNEGATARVHLVLDGIVNDWLRQYFQHSGHRVVRRPEPLPNEQYSREDQHTIIAQLRLLRAATADKLADEMEAALASREE